jgi:hypothetical protein
MRTLFFVLATDIANCCDNARVLSDKPVMWFLMESGRAFTVLDRLRKKFEVSQQTLGAEACVTLLYHSARN